ncbi:unnamed protein product [Linum trigynum]|uniref:Uncharacterized protein n=1 Tax=Linum trigynum TaxID=586398 RepID=A0AAV2EUZ1_9ROSI
MVEESCAWFTQEQLLTVGEEKEDEEASLEDELERSEVVMDGHRDAKELKCPLEESLHFISSIIEEVINEVMRKSEGR